MPAPPGPCPRCNATAWPLGRAQQQLQELPVRLASRCAHHRLAVHGLHGLVGLRQVLAYNLQLLELARLLPLACASHLGRRQHRQLVELDPRHELPVVGLGIALEARAEVHDPPHPMPRAQQLGVVLGQLMQRPERTSLRGCTMRPSRARKPPRSRVFGAPSSVICPKPSKPAISLSGSSMVPGSPARSFAMISPFRRAYRNSNGPVRQGDAGSARIDRISYMPSTIAPRPAPHATKRHLIPP